MKVPIWKIWHPESGPLGGVLLSLVIAPLLWLPNGTWWWLSAMVAILICGIVYIFKS